MPVNISDGRLVTKCHASVNLVYDRKPQYHFYQWTTGQNRTEFNCIRISK